MPFRRSLASRHRAQGFTLLELILVLGVGAMITLLTFQTMRRNNESIQARAVGDEMRIVGQASNNYISARFTQLTQLTNAPGTTADPGPRTCAGNTCTITVGTLVNEGMLPNNYKNNNSFGSGYTINIVVSGVAPNWKVDGLVTTASPWNTSGIMRYDLLGQAMQEAGPDSGMTRNSPSQIDGYNGIWSETNATFNNITQLGLLGFRVGYGSSLYSVYLRRDGTLPMTGDLNMSDGTAHNIAGAANITGAGRLTMNEAYINYANVNGNIDAAGTLTAGGNAVINGGVYTNYVRSNGNLDVGGTATANKVVLPGGNSLQIGSSYYYGDGTNSAIRQSGTLYVQSQDGSTPAPINVGNITANDMTANNLTVNDVFITSRGHWLSDMAPVYSSRGAYYVTDGYRIAKPYCGAGIAPDTAGDAKIIVSPADQGIGVSINAVTDYGSGEFVARALDEGTDWLIQDETKNWLGQTVSAGGVIAQVFCSFG